MKKTAIIFCLITIFCLLGKNVKNVRGQTDTSLLTISPPTRELELPPGSSNSYQISIFNQSNKQVRLILRASPFVPVGESGAVDIPDEELEPSQNWVIINPNQLTLNPKERKSVTYTIALPKNASPGGFYFAVVAQLLGRADTSGLLSQTKGGSAVDLNISSLNLIKIAGEVSYDARISEFSTPKKIFEYGPVPFTLAIRNNSNVHIKPIMEIFVRNSLGIQEKTTLYLKQQNILPFTQRKYEAEFGGKWHFGRYLATLTVLYGDGSTTQYTLIFWILPWKIILAAILAIFILLLIGYLLGQKKSQEEEEIKIS